MSTETLRYIESRGFHMRGLAGGAALGLCGAAVACSSPLVTFDAALGAALSSCGWMAFALGIGMRFWATLYVGGRKVGGRRDATLTVDGPYSIVRNPLYVGSLLIGLSAPLCLHSATLLIAVLAAALHYAFVTVPAEETFLRELVGSDTFDAYCRRTPRFIPNFRLYRTSAEITIYAKALRNETRRALRLLVVPAGLTLLAVARGAEWWPAFFRLP
ncbi:MAG: isoprenylcysteine carboxylmethyltransferase family protein [Planctomycetia bacterium]|nr:isoprenylcysteine carboxylmethyltransferase family protein [Planctomycetia bacterium]